jgi:hypothetical protein
LYWRHKAIYGATQHGVAPFEGVFEMKKFALLAALAFAAPALAVAAPADNSVAQKVMQTYHTSFPGYTQNNAQTGQ